MEAVLTEVKQINVSRIFNAQVANQQAVKNSTTEQRKAKLKKLKAAIEARESEIFEALNKDLRKSVFESCLSEVYFIYGEIDFALKNLSKWNTPKKVPSNLINI